MIAIDTSALIAVVNHEPERPMYLAAIARAETSMISAVTLPETRIVTFARFGSNGIDVLSQWLASFSPQIVPFDEVQSEAAFAAFQRYGKGINPKAGLNFGDCAAYALAKTRNAPLLFKGTDFAVTDLSSAS